MSADPHPMKSSAENAPALYIAYDGTMGKPWAVVARFWDAAATAWAGIGVFGQIAANAADAIRLVQRNGTWPKGVEFIAYPPGTPIAALVWGPDA